jgi:aspartyl protease family protein
MIRFLFNMIPLFLISCSHPEEESFKRNQGQKNTFINSSEEQISNSAPKNYLEMEESGGVKFVWLEVNGIRLKFIFDTGASSICISPVEARVLLKQGTLTEKDFLGTEFFQDATGRVSEGLKVNLRSVIIANQELKNVEAIIVENDNAPLLLGQTVLERFGKIEIDNENGVISFR